MSIDLRERWRARFHVPGRTEASEAALEAVLAAWSEPHRHYHTLEHLAECLALADQHPARDPLAVEAALWFHDVVCAPMATDNEQRSAVAAEHVLKRLGLPVGQVPAWILATAEHTPLDDPDGQLVLDIDMSILAAPDDRFDEYNAQVRREYELIPDRLYVVGRNAFLASVLARPKIFHTPAFAPLEERARANLRRALAESPSSG